MFVLKENKAKKISKAQSKPHTTQQTIVMDRKKANLAGLNDVYVRWNDWSIEITLTHADNV